VKSPIGHVMKLLSTVLDVSIQHGRTNLRERE
jgi:hypothetical protein